MTAQREASRKDHLPFEAKHIDDLEWETIRWPGETGKMFFHPRAERPTEPNAGILRLADALDRRHDLQHRRHLVGLVGRTRRHHAHRPHVVHEHGEALLELLHRDRIGGGQAKARRDRGAALAQLAA